MAMKKSMAPTTLACPSGLPRTKNDIAIWFSALTALHVFLRITLKDSELAIPSPEFCPSDQPNCTRPDLFAFQVCSTIALTYCGIQGVRYWHFTNLAQKKVVQTPEGRCFGYLPEAETIAAANFSFQFFDFLMSLTIEEHCTPVYMAHHSIAALVTFLSMQYQYYQYYGVFFFGCTEFSSVFLVYLDWAKFFPPAPGSLLDGWVGLCGPLFVLSFFVYRVFLWWKLSYTLWADSLRVYKNGMVHKLRPNSASCLLVGILSSVMMGLLQVYWSSLIIQEVMNVLSGAD